jgi:hypothetical protein
MSVDGCETCRALWGKYVEATHAHLKILGKQRIAAIQQDLTALKIIEADELGAQDARREARFAVQEHKTHCRAGFNRMVMNGA